MGNYGGIPVGGQAPVKTSKYGGISVEAQPQAPADRNFLNVSRDFILGPDPAAAPPPVGPVDRPMPMGEMADPNIQYRTELQKLSKAKGLDEIFSNPAIEASQAGFLSDWNDELTALTNAPGHALMDWYKGGTFDVGRAYTALQQQLDAQKRRRQAEHPIASAAGQIVGALGQGAVVNKAVGPTLNRVVPGLAKAGPVATTGLAVVEGGAQGALQGAGAAKPGERVAGAERGAVTGALTAGAIQTIGNRIATQQANRAASAAAPVAQDLKAVGQTLYDAAENEGVRYTPGAVQRLTVNLRAAAERLNKDLRPLTKGFVSDIQARPPGSMSFEEFAELRKRINLALKTASPDDARTLMQMKNATESFATSVRAPDFTGGNATRAYQLQRQADELWQRSKKAFHIENIMDIADVVGAGKFTQSGFNNALTTEMRKLYKAIQKGTERGWTPQEIALIRQMASGGSNSKMINLFAKFAPRGPVSALAGAAIGSLLPLPPIVGQLALPAIGHVAGRMAERGARQAGETLRSGVASGVAPRFISQPATNLSPLIPAGIQAGNEAERQLQIKRQLRSLTGG